MKKKTKQEPCCPHCGLVSVDLFGSFVLPDGHIGLRIFTCHNSGCPKRKKDTDPCNPSFVKFAVDEDGGVHEAKCDEERIVLKKVKARG